MNISIKLPLILLVSVLLFGCQNGIKQGDDLSSEELDFIKELGILNENEEIILFDSQSGESDEVKQAGNFFTEKRLASYWLDENDESKTKVNSAYYSEIDTIWFVDKSSSLWDGSYVKVETKDSMHFNVYVDGDSTDVWNFFKGAIKEWEKWN